MKLWPWSELRRLREENLQLREVIAWLWLNWKQHEDDGFISATYVFDTHQSLMDCALYSQIRDIGESFPWPERERKPFRYVRFEHKDCPPGMYVKLHNYGPDHKWVARCVACGTEVELEGEASYVEVIRP